MPYPTTSLDQRRSIIDPSIMSRWTGQQQAADAMNQAGAQWNGPLMMERAMYADKMNQPLDRQGYLARDLVRDYAPNNSIGTANYIEGRGFVGGQEGQELREQRLQQNQIEAQRRMLGQDMAGLRSGINNDYRFQQLGLGQQGEVYGQATGRDLKTDFGDQMLLNQAYGNGTRAPVSRAGMAGLRAEMSMSPEDRYDLEYKMLRNASLRSGLQGGNQQSEDPLKGLGMDADAILRSYDYRLGGIPIKDDLGQVTGIMPVGDDIYDAAAGRWGAPDLNALRSTDIAQARMEVPQHLQAEFDNDMRDPEVVKMLVKADEKQRKAFVQQWIASNSAGGQPAQQALAQPPIFQGQSLVQDVSSLAGRMGPGSAFAEGIGANAAGVWGAVNNMAAFPVNAVVGAVNAIPATAEYLAGRPGLPRLPYARVQ